MMRTVGPALGVGTLLLGATMGPPAGARNYQHMLQVSIYAPPRVYPDTLTLPVEEFERTRPPTRMRVDGHTYPLYWNNTVIGGYTTTAALRSMRRAGQRPTGVLADRRLTSA